LEFGNLKDIIYISAVLTGLICVAAGIIKKKNIVALLDLGRLKKTEYIKGILIGAGMLMVWIALLSPQKLESEKKIEVEGLSVYILVDTSRSMLAEDVFPSRIEAAKRTIREVVEGLTGDRVGIIPFSSSAYIQMPLTTDYNIAKNYVDVIDTKLISGGGTKILEGLKLAENSYREIGSEKKVVLIISDGGEDEKGTIEFAEKHNMKVYSMGIGTEKGSVLPNYIDGVKRGFITDRNGNTVISRLNEGFLKKLSEETGGRYYRVDNLTGGGERFASDIAGIQGDEKRQESIKVYSKYYQYPLFLGIILILIGVAVGGGIKDEED